MTSFKWFLVTLGLIMVFMFTWMFLDIALAERYDICCVNAGGGLNVREGPGTEYRTSFLLADQAKVVVIETHDNWALVNFQSMIGKREPFGWVCMDYLHKCFEVEIE